LRLFGGIDDGQLASNDLGRIVAECWFDLPRHYPHVALDAFVVMPNHIHGIIVLRGYDEVPNDASVGAGLRPAHPPQTTVSAGQPDQAGLRPAPTTADDDSNGPANAIIDFDDDAFLANAADTLVGAGLRPVPTTADAANDVVTKRHALPEIVRAFKSFSARRINEHRHTPAVPTWQRNYYEHVIRSEQERARVRIYIQDNPARWTLDQYYTADEMAR